MAVKQTQSGSGGQNPPNAIQTQKKNFFTEVWTELKKTNWPTPNDGVRLTGIVLLVIAIFGLFLFAMDVILSQIWHLLTPPHAR